MSDLQIGYDLDNTVKLSNHIFFAEGLKREFVYNEIFSWATDTKKPHEVTLPFRPLASGITLDNPGTCTYEAYDGNALMVVAVTKQGAVSGSIIGASPEAVEAVKRDLLKALPKGVKQSHKLTVFFWHFIPNKGADLSSRIIDIPYWADIEENYADSTLEGLNPLMKRTPEDVGGKLLLWQGEPGTGKTYALRALGHEWREHAEFHYVIDPDVFFKTPGYMMQVLLREASDDKHKLLVLEDSGEMLTADAKYREGQGLSRLLNSVDGILGQGLKLMILMTTNESLGEMHPAVSRDGRCASTVKFEPLEPKRSNQWLEDRGLEGRGRTMALSELYAATKDTLPKPKRQSIGFAVQ